MRLTQWQFMSPKPHLHSTRLEMERGSTKLRSTKIRVVSHYASSHSSRFTLQHTAMFFTRETDGYKINTGQNVTMHGMLHY